MRRLSAPASVMVSEPMPPCPISFSAFVVAPVAFAVSGFSVPPETDQAGVRREYSSYCGNYTFDGTRLVTRVDAASDPSRIDSDQVQYTPQGRLPTATDFPRS